VPLVLDVFGVKTRRKWFDRNAGDATSNATSAIQEILNINPRDKLP
jgi:hypothetical protein